jgi:hypothetical protein
MQTPLGDCNNMLPLDGCHAFVSLGHESSGGSHASFIQLHPTLDVLHSYCGCASSDAVVMLRSKGSRASYGGWSCFTPQLNGLGL